VIKEVLKQKNQQAKEMEKKQELDGL